MTIKALLFDKDGTLLDFDATFAPATAAVLSELCGGRADEASVLARRVDFDFTATRVSPGSVLIAGSLMDIAMALYPDGSVEEHAQLSGTLDLLYLKHTQDTVVAMPGLSETLLRLQALGFPMGVATNDSEAGAHKHLGKLGVAHHFSFIAGYDSGHGAKPEPGMVHAFADHLGLLPEEIAMVGDSPHDCLTAKHAGALALGVLSGGADRETLGPHADHILASIAELPEFLTRPDQ